MVMFLLKAFFWIGLFVMILTVDDSFPDPKHTSSAVEQHEEVSQAPLLFVVEFCTTNPHWCEAIHNASMKAYTDITSVIDALQDHFSGDLKPTNGP